MNYICTTFYHSEGKSPNLAGSENIDDKFLAYHQCIVVMFTSAKIHNDAKLVFFTDRTLPDEIEKKLILLGVEIIIIPRNSIKYVNAFENKFPGCLFLLDGLEYIANQNLFAEDDKFLFVDSDCIVRSKIDFSEEFSGYKIDLKSDENMNYQSIRSLNSIGEKFYHENKPVEKFKFFGGEYYIFSKKRIDMTCNQISKLVEYISNEADLKGQSFTEEHILSIVMNYEDSPANATSQIERIWMTRGFNNVSQVNIDASIYHLPSEKKKLFFQLYEKLKTFDNRWDEMHYLLSDYVKEYVLAQPKPSFLAKLYREIRSGLKS